MGIVRRLAFRASAPCQHENSKHRQSVTCYTLSTKILGIMANKICWKRRKNISERIKTQVHEFSCVYLRSETDENIYFLMSQVGGSRVVSK